jgi:hypothetical protein
MNIKRVVAAPVAFLIVSVLLEANSWCQNHDIASCAGIDQGNETKIVVSEFKYERPDGSTVELLDDMAIPIRFSVLSRLGNLFSSDEVAEVLCSDRSPRKEDFDSSYMDILIQRDVLLELWGNISENQSDSADRFTANMTVMILPVGAYDRQFLDMSSHILRFPSTKCDDVETAFSELVLGPQFSIYSYLAMALRAFRDEDYVQANNFITSARLTWESVLDDPQSPQMIPEADVVSSYLDNLSDRIQTAGIAAGDLDSSAFLASEILEEGQD